ncbi:50S ribosomal protein L21 [Candidatus Roizmanbacteria bacterium]|nr:50S ribosomal protein L21 [Candidatus Roizmanbacteria bacterium]
MATFAVVKTGGKQYLVQEGQEIVVDRMAIKEKEKVELETLMTFDQEGKAVEIGTPLLAKKVQAEVITHSKGEKIRISRFKSKVRYRKVRGFRPQLTSLKIVKI